MNTIQTLPLELLDSIIAFVAPESILRLATVMRYFSSRLGYVRRICIVAGSTLRLPVSRIWPQFQPAVGTCEITKVLLSDHITAVSALVQILDVFGGHSIIRTTEPLIIRDWKQKNLLTKRINLKLSGLKPNGLILLEFHPNTVFTSLTPSSLALSANALAVTAAQLVKFRIEQLEIQYYQPTVILAFPQIRRLKYLSFVSLNCGN
ncbi:hypothetical protein HK100_009698 [Physocladia obscura]|uniref:F-box domain-containing protein n=1 Tax=Physocladia obscura TaxID=109957 RepID=A0AAD5ST22_9FUNG|nr:hypothetical protein HK100_009698 [Physocladia obscura]